MLNDPQFQRELEQLISQRHYAPEYAVSRTLRRYAKVFQSLESSHIAARAGDIADIEQRLLRHLLGERREELAHLTSPVLVLAYSLTPSEAANLDRRYVRGFVTETGAAGSHTAIVAEALAIPAVVGTGPFLSEVAGGDLVIIDGNQGLVILQPDEETIARYQREAEQHRSLETRLAALTELPAVTKDGTRIQVMGNIEFPHEARMCRELGCDGIGLYRTEFLYLSSDTIPDEEDHYQSYAYVMRQMESKPVVIRTLDLGADKLAAVAHRPAEDEPNPFLGLRSIRLSLRNLPLFRTQLRALLRASVLGDLRIMFPLISTVMELRQARMVLADVMEDLDEAQVPFQRQLKVGMMVEVPAAVIMIDQFVEEVDFLSIGTNDLIQYALAVDRSNKEVAGLYSAADPAVLRLIQLAVRGACRANRPISLCGQMSGYPMYTMLLLGLGLRQLSVPPAAIPEIKQLCRSVSLAQCEEVAARAMALEHARDVAAFLREELRKAAPELAVQ